MAWDRVVKLFVGEDGKGLEISGLDLSFDIRRANTPADNTATFVIYNAKEQTRREVLKKGNNLIFEAGYIDEGTGTLFIGNITSAVSKKQDDTWVTKVTAASIRATNQPLKYVIFTGSYIPGTKLSTVIQEIGNAIGLVVIGATNADVELPNGWTYAGSLRGALKYCQKILNDNDKALYIDNNELVIFNTGDRDSQFSVLQLDYTSGLLRAGDITEVNASDNKNDKDAKAKETEKPPEKRIEFEAILLPKLQPNILVQIESETVNGVYLVEIATFRGDNMGGTFQCKGEAVE